MKKLIVLFSLVCAGLHAQTTVINAPRVFEAPTAFTGNIITLKVGGVTYFGVSYADVTSKSPNSAWGRTAAINTAHVFRIGTETTGDYDLYSAAGGSPALDGLVVQPTFKMGSAHGNHYGLYVRPTSIDDGSARTVTNQYSLYIRDGQKGASTTVTNAYGLYVEASTVGTTLNRSAYFGGAIYGATTSTFAGSTVADSGLSTTVVLGSAGTYNAVSLGGTIARQIGVARHETADTAGSALTDNAGGATSGSTNKAGGNRIIQSGVGTGNATGSSIIFQTPTAIASGTADQTAVTRLTVNEVAATFVPPIILTTALGTTYGGLGASLAAAGVGTYPKSDGATPAVFGASTLAASGVGTPTACTNQFVTGFTLAGDTAPTSTCTSIVAGDLGTTLTPQFARVGAGQVADATAPFAGTIDSATTNTILDVLKLTRSTTGTAGNGIGTGLVLYSEDASGNIEEAGRIQASFPVATHATQTGRVDITAMGAAAGTGVSILQSGNVGIGTTVPGAVLDIRGSSDTAGSGVLKLASAGNGIRWTYRIGDTLGELNLDRWTGAAYATDMTFKGGNVGIGTTSPTEKAHVWGGNVEVADPSVLGTESLNETAFATHVKWDVTGDFDDTGGNATYTDATHSGTLTQTAVNQAVAAVGSRWYKFVYDVTTNTLTGTPVVTITTAYSLAAQTLDVTVAANKAVYFKSAVAPTDFVISITGTTGGVLVFDNFSLTEVVGGTGIFDGFVNWSGQKRVKVQFDKTSDTTLADVTGLSVAIEAGKIYTFEAILYTTSNVGGGVKAAIGCVTCTATSIVYEGLTIDAGLTTQGRSAALGTAVGAVTAATAGLIKINGTIVVNAAGTLTVQFAQNASNGAASSVLVGSTFIVQNIL